MFVQKAKAVLTRVTIALINAKMQQKKINSHFIVTLVETVKMSGE